MRLLRLGSLALTSLVALAAGGTACDNGATPPAAADTTSVPLDDFSVVKTTFSDEQFGTATDGTNFLVTFTTSSTTGTTATPAVQLISQTAKIGGPLTFPTNFNDVGVAAWDGARYLTVMQQGIAANGSDLYGQFIDKAGATDGPQFKVTTVGNGPFAFSLTYGGGAYLLTYARGEFDPTIADSSFFIMARRIGTDGLVGPELTLSNRGLQSAAAFDGTNFLVAYAVAGTTSPQLRGRFISTAGVLGNDVPLSPLNTPVNSPVGVAFNGSNYLVAWGDLIPTDNFGNDSSLFVESVATDGTPSAPARIPTNFPLAKILGVMPFASGFYVTWAEADGIEQLGTRGARVTTAGVIGNAVTLFQPDTLSTSVIGRLTPISSTQAMAIVNRKIHGQWDIYAKLLTLP